MRGTAIHWGALSGLCLTVACADYGESTDEVSQKIAEGDPDPSVNAIGAVVRSDGALCSGTLITPNLVLTARHCIAGINGPSVIIDCDKSRFDDPVTAARVSVTFGGAIGDQGMVDVEEISVPSAGDGICGYDIAVLRLAHPIDNVTPLSPRITPAPERGELYEAVGFGRAGPNGPSGKRYRRGGLAVRCAPGYCDDGVAPTEFRGEEGACNGDSGGPALDEQGHIMGVVSRGGASCSAPVYASVVHWSGWLAAAAEATMLDAEPAWVAAERSFTGGKRCLGQGCSKEDPAAAAESEFESFVPDAPSSNANAAGGCAAGRSARTYDARVSILAAALATAWAASRRRKRSLRGASC